MIEVEFEGLEDLSPAELKAGLVRFTEARNKYAADGRPGMAALFNGLVIALDDERQRRKDKMCIRDSSGPWAIPAAARAVFLT